MAATIRSHVELCVIVRSARRRCRGRAKPRGDETVNGLKPEGPSGDGVEETTRLVVFAYECAPGGSERGIGWEFSRIAAHLGETWVLCADDDSQMEAVRNGLATLPERSRLHFVPIAAPRWSVAFGKIGRFPGRLYLAYALWQIRALRVARRIDAEHHISLVWHVSWSNAWFGTLAARMEIPFVYGPVGAGVGPPWRLVPSMGLAGMAREATRAAARWCGRHLNPVAHLALQRAAVIMTQNPETVAWLPADYRAKAVIVPAPVLNPLPIRTRTACHEPPVAIFVGRIQTWKGVGLAVRTLVHLPGWRLLLCGSGPDVAWLERLAARLKVADRVRFLGRVPHERVLELMREEADVMLFPSYHDEGGWAVSEAIACGLPVVCLDRGGPAALGGHAVPAGAPEATARQLAAMTLRVAGHPELGPIPDFDHQLSTVQEIFREHRLIPAAADAG
jgi:glycosyltransferase involved in cell wall biosynthesis